MTLVGRNQTLKKLRWSLAVAITVLLGWSAREANAVVPSYTPSAALSPVAAKGVTPLPNGEVWGLDMLDHADEYSVFKVSSGDVVSKLKLPGVLPRRTKYTSLVLGPDGAVWIAARRAPYKKRSTIFRVSMTGKVARFVPKQAMIIYAMTTAPDGRIWFIDGETNRVAKLELNGSVSITKFGSKAALQSMAQATNGDMWTAGAKVALRFQNGRLVQRTAIGESDASELIALKDGRMIATGYKSLQLLSRSGVESIPTNPATPSLTVQDVFLTPSGQYGYTEGALGGDESGPSVTGSRLGLIENGTVVSSQTVWKQHVEWVPNFATDTDFALSPGLKTIAVDQKGNLWAGTSWRTSSGLTKFETSDPSTPAPGTAAIVKRSKVGKRYTIRLRCDGAISQFCTGRIAVRLKGSGRFREYLNYAMRTGEQTSRELGLRRTEVVTASGLQ